MSAGGSVQDGRGGKQSNQNGQGKAKKKYSPLDNIDSADPGPDHPVLPES